MKMKLIILALFIVVNNLQQCFGDWQIFRSKEEIIRTLNLEGPEDVSKDGNPNPRLCAGEMLSRMFTCTTIVQFLKEKGEIETNYMRDEMNFQPLTYENSEDDIETNECRPLVIEGLPIEKPRKICRCTDVMFIRNVKNRNTAETSAQGRKKVEKIKYSNGIFISDSSKPNNYYIFTKKKDSDVMEILLMLIDDKLGEKSSSDSDGYLIATPSVF